MQIYRGETAIAEVKITDDSYRDFAIMGDDYIILDFYSVEEIEFRKNDYCFAFGERFSIVKKPVPTLKKGIFYYNFKLYNTYKELEKVKVFPYDGNRDLTQSEFSYTCTPLQLVQLIVNNLNAVQNHVWTVGDVIDGETKTITISGQNCLEVLTSAASEWKTEWYVSGFAVYLRERTFTTEPQKVLALDSGLKTVEQEENNFKAINRLYASGGTKNLPSGYGSKRLKMDVPYLEVVADDIVEDTISFEDIFPRRIGSVTAVRQNTSGIFFFDDSGLDFNPNDLQIDGLTKHIIFQSGSLVGYDFEVNYNSTTGEFEIIQYTESSGDILPSDDLSPAVGDTYILYNIEMPQSYVTAAENELKATAQAYFDKLRNDRLAFNITTDETEFTARDMSLQPGEIVTLQHDFIEALKDGLNIRVTGFKRYINQPNRFDAVKVSDTVYVNPVSSVQNKVDEIERIIDRTGLSKQSYYSRNWRDVEEIAGMVESLRARFLLIGDEDGQFELKQVIFTANYEGNPDAFNATAGQLIHEMVPDSENPGTWNMSAFTGSLDSEATAYYLYAKCSRTTDQGEFVFDENMIDYDADANYYYFLIGVISSLHSNNRSFQTLYGFSEFAGNQITTGILKSKDGRTSFNLDTGIIQGVIRFIAPDGITIKELNQMTASDWGADAFGSASQALADAISYADGIKTQIDGDIDDVEGLIGDLDTYIDVAFHDGVISEAEAKKIQSYINQLNTEKADVDNRYTSIYNNTDLSGTPKSNLSTAKTAYNTAHANLIGAINNAIADGKTTPAESAAVDAAFANYSAALATLSTRFEEAVNYIAYVKAQNALGDANDYADGLYGVLDGLKLNAVINGKTLIVGGYINTEFINTSALVISGANVSGLGALAFLSGLTASQVGADPIGSASNALTSAQNYTNMQVQRTSVTVDLTGLDQNTYYPITIGMQPTKPYTITVERTLRSDYGVPSYSTHENGIAVTCRWTSNGSGWGTIEVNRTIHVAEWAWCSGTPAGSIGQMTNSSNEYIYVRGGSKYDVTVEGTSSANITLHTTSYTVNNQTISLLSSVTAPTVTMSDLANAAQSAAEAYALAKANLAETTAKAYADGVVSDEEARAIADAQAKADAARVAAISASAADATNKVNELDSRSLVDRGQAPVVDWNTITTQGIYVIYPDHFNMPNAPAVGYVYPYGVLRVESSSNFYAQTYSAHQGSEVYTRVAYTVDGWQSWRRIEDTTGAQTKANNAQSNAISTAAGDATTKANNAQTNAISTAATDATNKMNSAMSYAYGLYDTLSTNKLDAIVNGKTIIVNGYLNTQFIEAGSITADLINFDNAVGNNVYLTGVINVQNGGRIGNLNITGGGLYNDALDDSYAGIFLSNASGTKAAAIGLQALDVATGLITNAYFKNTHSANYDIYAAYFYARNTGALGLGRGVAVGANGDVVVTNGGIYGNVIIPDSDLYQMLNQDNAYLPAGYHLYENSKYTANRDSYLPNPALYKTGECIIITNYNNYDINLRPYPGTQINGQTSKSIRLHNNLDSVTLRAHKTSSAGSTNNSWMAIMFGGTALGFE
jgi:hypothetical protein